MLNVFNSIFSGSTIIVNLWYVVVVAVSFIYEIFGTNLLFLHRKHVTFKLWYNVFIAHPRQACFNINFIVIFEFFVIITMQFLFLIPSLLLSASFFWLSERGNSFCLDVILNFANNFLPTRMHFSVSSSYTFSIIADCDLIFLRCCLNDVILNPHRSGDI